METSACKSSSLASLNAGEVRGCLAGKDLLLATSRHFWKWLVATRAPWQCAAFAHFPETRVGNLPHLSLYRAAIVVTMLPTEGASYLSTYF